MGLRPRSRSRAYARAPARGIEYPTPNLKKYLYPAQLTAAPLERKNASGRARQHSLTRVRASAYARLLALGVYRDAKALERVTTHVNSAQRNAVSACVQCNIGIGGVPLPPTRRRPPRASAEIPPAKNTPDRRKTIRIIKTCAHPRPQHGRAARTATHINPLTSARLQRP